VKQKKKFGDGSYLLPKVPDMFQ